MIGVLFLLASIYGLVRIARTDDLSYSVQRPTMVNHRVLFLCSYNSLYFTYDDQVEGLKQALYPNGIEFDVVYMDTKSYGTPNDKLVFYEFFKNRLRKAPEYEAILLGDDDALEFALTYQEELFEGIPMVFLI